MSNIIQSFYSPICTTDWMFTHSCYFYLSSLYAHQSNINITLYTDYNFKEVLESAPYKEICVLFKDYSLYNNINRLFWAWPKFIALDAVPRDTIHIDGDVFLKDNSCLRLLDIGNYDVMCQHLEYKAYKDTIKTSYEDSFNAIKDFDYPEYIVKSIPESMPNNGVLCVQNENLWNEYRDIYWKMLEQGEKINELPQGWCIPDIIFEQQFLKEICDYRGYSMKYILEGTSENELNIDAASKNYQHVCSDKKGKLQLCINLIRKKSNICYETLKYYWAKDYPEYFE